MIIPWTQDIPIISASTIIHHLEDVVGVSDGNMERDAAEAAIIHPDSGVVKMGQGKSRLSGESWRRQGWKLQFRIHI